VPLLKAFAPSDADAIRVCVLSCVPRDSVWRRGKSVSAMARHPSSPNLLPPASCKSTKVDLEVPLPELLLVGGDLLDEQGQPVGSERLVVWVERGVPSQ
jgi:hypothetical protein